MVCVIKSVKALASITAKEHINALKIDATTSTSRTSYITTLRQQLTTVVTGTHHSLHFLLRIVRCGAVGEYMESGTGIISNTDNSER